jgi:TM2 domain-containing membrane protein YozV
MNCEFCDAPIPPGAQRCPNCGGTSSAPAAPMGAAPAAPYAPHPQAMAGPPAKSKVAAGVLAILLGAFGIHNFYLGFTGKGVAQLLITLLTCGYGALITGIWALVEGILILTSANPVDAQGRPLS